MDRNELNNMTLTALTEIYNDNVNTQVKVFKTSKSKAVDKVWDVLEARTRCLRLTDLDKAQEIKEHYDLNVDLERVTAFSTEEIAQNAERYARRNKGMYAELRRIFNQVGVVMTKGALLTLSTSNDWKSITICLSKDRQNGVMDVRRENHNGEIVYVRNA